MIKSRVKVFDLIHQLDISAVFPSGAHNYSARVRQLWRRNGIIAFSISDSVGFSSSEIAFLPCDSVENRLSKSKRKG